MNISLLSNFYFNVVQELLYMVVKLSIEVSVEKTLFQLFEKKLSLFETFVSSIDLPMSILGLRQAVSNRLLITIIS